jgi:hypothetical protein
MAETEKAKRKIFSRKNLKLIILIIIAFIIVITPSVYFYIKYTQSQNLLQNKAGETTALIDKVSKLIVLPKNETPTIATVSDKTKLENQPFFTNAENGDRVLIYSLAKKAILYRPSKNIIIDVAPVNLGANTPVSQQTPTTTVPVSKTPSSSPTPAVKTKAVSLLILNGTKIAGLASTAKSKISGQVNGVDVISLGDSVGNFTKTIIVDPSLNKTIDNELVAIVGGTVTKTMPDGEKAAKQDIVIILGSDFNK